VVPLRDNTLGAVSRGEWGDRLSLLRRRIGIVFQDYKLIPRHTMLENGAFVL